MVEVSVAHFSLNMSSGVVGPGDSDSGLINGHTVSTDHWQMLGTGVLDNWGSDVSSSISDWGSNMSSISEWGSSYDSGISVTYFSFDMGGSMMGTSNSNSGLIYWDTVSSNDGEVLGTGVVDDGSSNMSNHGASDMGGVGGDWSYSSMSGISVANGGFNMGGGVFSFGKCNSRFIDRHSVSTDHLDVLGTGVVSVHKTRVAVGAQTKVAGGCHSQKASNGNQNFHGGLCVNLLRK